MIDKPVQNDERRRWKAITFPSDLYETMSVEDDISVCLSEWERTLIIAALTPALWRTRWYSENPESIEWDDIRQQVQALIKKLVVSSEDCTMDCNEVWACLGIDPVPDDLLEWLLDQLQNNPDLIDVIVNPPPGTVSPVATQTMVEECDKDHVFPFALQLVQFINTAIEDLFEVLEAITNSVEFGQVVLQSVPVAAAVADFVDYLQEELAEEYLAEYTTTLENEYACEIMCLIVSQEDCTATWEDVYEYFLQRFGAGLANKNIFDLLNYIGGGGLTGTVFCDAAFAAFCGIMHYGDTWLDISLKGIQNFWNSWINDTNTDWTSLCTGCGWSLDQALDSAHTETYWDATCGIVDPTVVRSKVCGVGFRGLIINITLPTDSKVNMVKTYSRYDGHGETGKGRLTLFDDEDNVLQNDDWDLPVMSGSSFDTHIKYFDQNEVHRVKLELITSFDPAEGGYAATNQIQLTGSGSDPFA